MLLSEFVEHLSTLESVNFILPNQSIVAPHFHITEIGELSRRFVDCAGKVRTTNKINFQLWVDHDTHHRLSVIKLKGIITKAKRVLELGDYPISVEYQGQTIESYGLEKHSKGFELIALQTTCLSPQGCVVDPVEEPIESCAPNSGCC